MVMAMKYDESNIQQLDWVEHIRKRPGMYIGEVGTGAGYHDCIYILLKEIIDNAIDEFVVGAGKQIDVKLNYETGEVEVRDYGRGIPLGKVVDCVSQMNTGGKFNSEAFQFSAGMNGVGTKAVNALSEFFEVRAFREGEYSEATFRAGKFVSKKRGKAPNEPNGTYVHFKPDVIALKKFKFREEHVERRMKMYCYVNAGLTINFNDKKFKSSEGLADLIADEAQFEKLYKPFHYRSKMMEMIFTHTNRFAEEYYTFVNGQYTTEGGTHLTAFKEALTKAVNEYEPKKKFDGDDVREGLLACVAVRMTEPVFEGQTKTKLGNTELRAEFVAEMKKAILEMLHRDRTEADKLINKIEETTKLRSQLNTIKKKSRERTAAVSVRVPQLRDSKDHLRLDKQGDKKGWGEDTMIFLTEGQSAGGTITQARDAVKQAVYFLRGKPLNVCRKNRDTLYENEEFFNLIKALDVEEKLERLRYGKIIFATDADMDGMHIRNLLITFFMRFYRQLIVDGRVYILETPLFRVRGKVKGQAAQFYCYTDEERVEAIAKCGKSAEITRFKGLGEVGATEFKGFIGPEMRLTPVTCSDDINVERTIDFFMGSNTPDRREYIMENLICNEEAFE